MLTPDEHIRAVRTRSRLLFGGAQYRLEVAAAIAAGDGVVNLKDLAEVLGDPPGTSSVNAELKVLERSGLLDRLESRGGDRRVYLLRRESPYWGACVDLAARATAETPLALRPVR